MRTLLERPLFGHFREDFAMPPDSKGCQFSFLMDYLMGVATEDRKKRHKEILSTSVQDFKKFADAINSVKNKGVVVAVGSPLDVTEAIRKRPKLFKPKLVRRYAT
ncbi:hypothetical protein ACFX2F_034760 [Malus domestica]